MITAVIDSSHLRHRPSDTPTRVPPTTSQLRSGKAFGNVTRTSMDMSSTLYVAVTCAACSDGEMVRLEPADGACVRTARSCAATSAGETACSVNLSGNSVQ